jgi:hypothetical protein
MLQAQRRSWVEIYAINLRKRYHREMILSCKYVSLLFDAWQAFQSYTYYHVIILFLKK